MVIPISEREATSEIVQDGAEAIILASLMTPENPIFPVYERVGNGYVNWSKLLHQVW